LEIGFASAKTSWLTLGGPLLSYYACTIGENSPLALHSTHFRWGSFFSQSGRAVASQELWLLQGC